MVKATAASEAGQIPSTELLEAMGRYNEELTAAGILLAGEGLRPSSHGARVRFNGSERTVFEGSFPETEQLVAGFWLWECRRWRRPSSGSSVAPTRWTSARRSRSGPWPSWTTSARTRLPELRERNERLRAAT